MNDSRSGEDSLTGDFEAAPWEGQAGEPRCHWIRGFIAGALSALLRQQIAVAETECQAKGDARCRFVFEPAS